MQLENIQKLCLCIHPLIENLTNIFRNSAHLSFKLVHIEYKLTMGRILANLLPCLHTIYISRFCCFFPKILNGRRCKNTRKWLEIPSSLWLDSEMVIRGREQECFSNFAESNILAESVAQPLSVWTLMNAHFAIFVINIQGRWGRGWWQGGYNSPALHTLHSRFPLLLYSPFSPFSIEKYKYCCLLCNILIFLPLPIFSELLPPALSPPASHPCPPPPSYYAVEPPKYVHDERKRYRESFRKY